MVYIDHRHLCCGAKRISHSRKLSLSKQKPHSQPPAALFAVAGNRRKKTQCTTGLCNSTRYLNNNIARIVGYAANKKSDWRNQLFTSPPPASLSLCPSPPPSLPPFLYPFLLKASGKDTIFFYPEASTRASTQLLDLPDDLQQKKRLASMLIQADNIYFLYTFGKLRKGIGQNDQGDKVEISIGKSESASLLKSHFRVLIGHCFPHLFPLVTVLHQSV